MIDRQAPLLRIAFVAGAITDAAAVVPLLVPPMARLMWGFDDPHGAYRFAMGYAASLMLGWTALLIWASQRPVERAGVAALTVLVIYGLVVTELLAVLSGYMPAWRMIPTWILQAVLLGLFASAYHYPWLRRVASLAPSPSRRGPG
ncbi:MAG TPA: hypothetical protein VMW17_21850 [Candidatus Binatia bacterium]|nr:hypothetical protein [Candidatus Binatia bacterium]